MLEIGHFTAGEDGGRPLVEIEDILAVHALVTTYARHRSRTRTQHAFVIRDGTVAAYDGTTDTYFGCRVMQPAPDQTHMAVSFMTYANTPELAGVNNREYYMFDWLKDGRCQAWHSIPKLSRAHLGLPFEYGSHTPVTPEDCVDLRNRIEDIVERVNPILPGSIYRPQ